MYFGELLVQVSGSLVKGTSLAVKRSSFTSNTALSVTVQEMHTSNVCQGARFRV